MGALNPGPRSDTTRAQGAGILRPMSAEADPHRTPRPPLYLRAAVIVGATCVLFGVAGLVWLPEPPPLPAFVRIDSPLPDGTGVRTRWTDRRGVHTEDGVGGREKDVWLFYRVPDGKPVTIQIVADPGGNARVLWQGPAVLESGTIFVVQR